MFSHPDVHCSFSVWNVIVLSFLKVGPNQIDIRLGIVQILSFTAVGSDKHK